METTRLTTGKFVVSGATRWSAPVRIPGSCRLTIMLVASCVAATRIFGADPLTAGHGTSEVMMITPSSVIVAADSKEIHYSYYSDGTTARAEKNLCKLRHSGGVLAVAAGFVHMDTFDALDVVQSLQQSGETVRQTADRLITELPARFLPVLRPLEKVGDPEFRKSVAERDVLQIGLVAFRNGSTEAELIAFHVTESSAGLDVTAQRRHCPGDCSAFGVVWSLGVHDAIDRFLTSPPTTKDLLNAQYAVVLSGLEYSDQPEIVGGPRSLVRFDRSGLTVLQPGACGEDDFSGRENQVSAALGHTPDNALSFVRRALDDHIAAAEDLVCHERTDRYSLTSDHAKQDTVDADLRIVEGVEEYSGIMRAGRRYRRLSDLPGPWTQGELGTILRMTRREVASRPIRTRSIKNGNDDETFQVEFDSPVEDSAWQLHVGSNIYPTAFKGVARFSRSTGALLRIHWSSTYLGVPPYLGIRQLDWDVTFGSVVIAGKTVVAPLEASLQVGYDEHLHRTDRAEVHFSDYQRYGSTASVSFASLP